MYILAVAVNVRLVVKCDLGICKYRALNKLVLDARDWMQIQNDVWQVLLDEETKNVVPHFMIKTFCIFKHKYISVI